MAFWNKQPKANTTITVLPGTPMGLLLSLTYPTQFIVNVITWTNQEKSN